MKNGYITISRIFTGSGDFTICGETYRFGKVTAPIMGESDDLYFALTSGTVSKTAKIVQVSCTALMENVTFFRPKFDDKNGDAVCVLSPLTFDPAIMTLFEGLFNSSKIILFSSRAILDGRAVRTVLSTEPKLKRIFLTPSLFRRFSPLTPFL